MKKLMLVAVLGLAVAACNDPPRPAFQAPAQPTQITMTNWVLQQNITVSKAGASRIGAGQLQVNVELYNSSDHTIRADYKYWFTDKNGIGVDNQSGWQLVTVPPKGFQQFTITSMSAMADDFRVQLRPAQ